MFRTADRRLAESVIHGGSAQMIPGWMRRVLGVNAVPHPRWLDLQWNALAALSKGGAAWLVPSIGAVLLGVRGSGRMIRGLVPAVVAATVAQYPLKALFHRPRPFSASVRQAVFRRPQKAEAAFPSGDAAANFAAAWVLGRTWPRLAAPSLMLAALFAASRVAAGVHRPEDVAAGAAIGLSIGELAHRAACDWARGVRGRAKPPC